MERNHTHQSVEETPSDGYQRIHEIRASNRSSSSQEQGISSSSQAIYGRWSSPGLLQSSISTSTQPYRIKIESENRSAGSTSTFNPHEIGQRQQGVSSLDHRSGSYAESMPFVLPQSYQKESLSAQYRSTQTYQLPSLAEMLQQRRPRPASASSNGDTRMGSNMVHPRVSSGIGAQERREVRQPNSHKDHPNGPPITYRSLQRLEPAMVLSESQQSTRSLPTIWPKHQRSSSTGYSSKGKGRAPLSPRLSSFHEGSEVDARSNKKRERWTDEEHQLFFQGLQKHGRKWKKIQAYVKTKTAVQVRTHAYGYFAKLLRNIPERVMSSSTKEGGDTNGNTDQDKRNREEVTDEHGLEVLRKYVFSRQKISEEKQQSVATVLQQHGRLSLSDIDGEKSFSTTQGA